MSQEQTLAAAKAAAEYTRDRLSQSMFNELALINKPLGDWNVTETMQLTSALRILNLRVGEVLSELRADDQSVSS